MRFKIIRIVVLVLFLFLLVYFPVQAQGSLSYGAGATGTLSATAPVLVYTFQGEAGDSVNIQVMGLTSGLQPALSLNTLTGLQVASSSNDPNNLASASARISARLTQSGIHTIIVTSLNGGQGDFAIRLDGIPTSEESPVDIGTPSDATVGTGTSVLIYSVPANPDTPLLASISTSSADVIFSVSVLAPDGVQIALLNGSSQQIAVANLAAATGDYTLEITVNAPTEASISVNVTPIGEAAEPVEDESDETVEATPTPADDTGQPTATYTPSYTPTTGANNTGNATPTYTATVAANVQVTATNTATLAPNIQATATYTPSYTPTSPPTATFTPSYTPTTQPAAQIAPEDARFNNDLNIALDNTASVLDFVSYPDGDTEDRVRFSITGMNNNSSLSGGRARLVIVVSCFGTNTDQVEIFTGGQSYSCGDTIVDREVTADSDTGSVVITAVGGTGTYVQWVLTGTATRVN